MEFVSQVIDVSAKLLVVVLMILVLLVKHLDVLGQTAVSDVLLVVLKHHQRTHVQPLQALSVVVLLIYVIIAQLNILAYTKRWKHKQDQSVFNHQHFSNVI